MVCSLFKSKCFNQLLTIQRIVRQKVYSSGSKMQLDCAEIIIFLKITGRQEIIAVNEIKVSERRILGH